MAQRRGLVLASGSRYRKALLERLGLPFEALSPQVDETPLGAEAPADTALRLSLLKARALAMYRRALCLQPGLAEASEGLAALDPPQPPDGSSLIKRLFRKSGP